MCGNDTGELLVADSVARVVLHDDWTVPGHAMVIARRHVENLSDLTDEESQRFLRIYRETERALLAATGCARAIVMKLGIATPHLHLHIYPFAATATRADVFAALEGKTKVERDAQLVERVRTLLAAQV